MSEITQGIQKKWSRCSTTMSLGLNWPFLTILQDIGFKKKTAKSKKTKNCIYLDNTHTKINKSCKFHDQQWMPSNLGPTATFYLNPFRNGSPTMTEKIEKKNPGKSAKSKFWCSKLMLVFGCTYQPILVSISAYQHVNQKNLSSWIWLPHHYVSHYNKGMLESVVNCIPSRQKIQRTK